MELLQLKYFCYAAATENFSETARAFRVPPSNISQSVKRLEEELGVPLFTRIGNRVVLNHRGQVFYQDARQALDLLERAGSRARGASERQEIRVGIQLLRRISRDFLAQAQKQFPDVDVTVGKFGAGSDPEEFDIIITDDSLTSETFTREQVRHDKLYLVSARGVLPEDAPVTVEGLRDLTFISHPPESVTYRNTVEICRHLGFEPQILTSEGHSHYFIPRSVEQGLGVALVTRRTRWVLFVEEVLDIRDIGEFYRDAYVYRAKRPYLKTRQMEQFYNLLVSALSS